MIHTNGSAWLPRNFCEREEQLESTNFLHGTEIFNYSMRNLIFFPIAQSNSLELMDSVIRDCTFSAAKLRESVRLFEMEKVWV